MVPVYVVSLARHTDRRKAISQHLGSLGVDFEVVDGVEGKLLDPSMVQAIVANPSLPLGHVGCYLSHLEVYRRITARNEPVALVLEDDARLSPRIKRLLPDNFVNAELPFDYCFLDWENFNRTGPVYFDARSNMGLGSDLRSVRLSGGPQTTHAYLITRRAAQLRLDHAFPICAPIDVYEGLPYEIVFAGIIRPRLAWLSEFALESSTFEHHAPKKPLERLNLIKRSHTYYRIRELVRLQPLRSWIRIRAEIASGRIPGDIQWKLLPSGKHVLW